MIVKHLGDTEFRVIIDSFLNAFENYFVTLPTDHEFYKQRWKASKVDFNLSFGMFDNDVLVGFILHAIDERYGHKIAFNTGTGVIPSFRGKRIITSIYEHALPILKENGIQKSVLEVITENHRAIKIYEDIGFNICRTLKCYNGEISIENMPILIKEVNFSDLDWINLPNQDLYSWDNYFECLNNGSYRYYQVSNGDQVNSYFVMNPENGYLTQFEILNEDSSSWTELFSAIGSISKLLKINNIDDRLIQKIKAVESVGLKNSVNQYEMELILSS